MTDYLRWSLRQLHLIFFWPTQFAREVEGYKHNQPKLRRKERFRYLLKMLPWIVALAVIGNFIVEHIYGALGIGFWWRGLWLGITFGVALGITFGVALGFADDVALSRALGVAVVVTTSILVGGALGAVVSTAFGVAFGVAYPLAFLLTLFRLATYPFDVVLSAATYFAGRQQPHAAARAWRWCPVTWNELIWLPLPFVGKLLALLVRQDREEGFRQIAFVAAERRLQRRAALAALIEVAADDLQAKSVAEMPDVSDKLNWTTNAPAELPAELMDALPRFDRAAQHVGQYLALHSVYRKGEALNRAVAEVEGLQRSLIAARGKAAPRLLQVANEWRRLLGAERESIRAQVEAAHEILNPFVFGNAVAETEHNVFTGRRDIVRQVEDSLLGATNAPMLLLHGPRRMGKTSILNQLPRLLGPDFAPAVIDCQNPAARSSEATLLRYLSRTLSEGLRRKRVAVEPLTATALEREPFAVFDEWLDGIERAMPGKMRALLCLDEYERLQSALDAGWGASFLDALRHLLQHRPRVALMFTGAHTFAELGAVWTDRFISARRVRVSFLTRDEVLPLLTKPIPEFDLTYAPGALDATIATTSGQPFLTQAVAFELVQFLNEQRRKEATTDDVEQAIVRALLSGGEYFANVWSDAGEQGQAILRALVRNETPPDFAAARVWLREHDVLNDAGRFAVPMVERWVREKA